MKKITAVLTAVILLFSAAAAQAIPLKDEFGYDKLLAFWRQEAYGGLNNGEAVYDHEWFADVNYWLFTEPPTYDGSWYTSLVEYAYDGFVLRFTCDYWYSTTFTDEFGYEVAVDGIDTITPDLYGMLDLSGTALGALSSPLAGQTHISSVVLDGCGLLNAVDFSGQEHCFELSALECPNLTRLAARNDALTTLRFSPMTFDEPVNVSVIGAGSVGAEYRMDVSEDTVLLIAYPADGGFIGWFENGDMVSDETEYRRTGGGNLTARFGGDADGDGAVTLNDALLVLRGAMELLQLPNEILASCDMNGDGRVNAADALIILRSALGLR